jgi:nicotinamide-nucleotide amidase
MLAELISIGDELLIGQTINTNASWLGQELALMGIRVKWITTISDGEKDIIDAIDQAFKRVDLILVTGGLGPTKDDITKHTLVKYFNTRLVMNQDVLNKVESFFIKRGREILEVNRQQAALPENCDVLLNNHGTASGMWFEKNKKVLISMPGVPYEMKGIMNDFGFSKIKSFFNVKGLYHKTLLTTGIGESFLASELSDWEKRLEEDGLSLAYLPSPGMVKLRVSSYNGLVDKEKVENYLYEVCDRFSEYVYGWGEDTLALVISDLALKHHLKIGTVESCTGGGVANTIVSIPGSSAYFEGALVTYSYDIKSKLASVSTETLEKYGAVSKETVIEMAEGGKSVLGVDYCVSISGIAGPDGGTEDKPVGTVWMAIAYGDGVVTKKIKLGDNRERNIQMTIFAALNFLRLTILEKIA